MAAAYRIWVGQMDRDIDTDILKTVFSPFGELSEGIRLKADIEFPRGAEAVIT